MFRGAGEDHAGTSERRITNTDPPLRQDHLNDGHVIRDDPLDPSVRPLALTGPRIPCDGQSVDRLIT